MVPVSGVGDGDILLVPAEHVLTFAVALPLPSHRKRIDALPFAIEDRIAVPVDSVHLALSADARAGIYLASVVDPAIMAAWVDLADAAGQNGAAIMPDALALPLPIEGRWTVMRPQDGRVLARLSDGRGFAANEAGFMAIWTAAGRPACDEVRHFPDHVVLAIDLRQGEYARSRGSTELPLRRVATIAAVGLLAHGAIAAADLVVLKSVAARRGLELQAQLAVSAPGAYPGMNAADSALIAAQMLPDGPVSAPSPMLPMLAKAAQALGPLQGALRYSAISYADAGGRLRFDFDAPDKASLNRAREALAAAGLSAWIEGSAILVGAEGGA